jgi:hypothetical protein
MWWIIGISVPIFYIYGLFMFISRLIRHSENNPENFTSKFILELEEIQRRTPQKSLNEIINEYKLKRKDVVADNSPPNEVTAMPDPNISIKKDLSEVSSNWYSENAISLLLYVGAFFIVASASIFVGFQWESLGGISKAVILSLLTIIFFITGIYCYGIPKIKTAGRVFVAIAALLIPFCGLAWYNFVLRDMGYSFGAVWFVTSFIAITTYIALAYILKHTFYPYITCVSALSLMFSIVNMNGLDSDFYILFGILTAFILSIVSIVLKSNSQDSILRETFSYPLDISSQVLMPIILLYGLIVAIDQEKLFTLQGTISLLLASIFYLTDYLSSKRIWSLAVAQILYPFTIMVLFKWQGYESMLLLYVLSLLSFADLCIAYLCNKYNRKTETDISIILGLLKLILIFTASFFYTTQPIQHVIFAVLPAGAAIIIAAIKKDFRYIGITSLFTAITIYIYMNSVLMLDSKLYYTSYIYLLCAISCYYFSIKYKQHSNVCQTLAISSIGFILLSLCLSFGFPGTLTIISFITAIMVTSGAYFFGNTKLIYAGNIVLYFTIINLLRYLNTEMMYYPLAFTAMSYALYALSQMLPSEYRKEYRYSALIANITTPVIFGLFSGENSEYRYSTTPNQDLTLETTALMSAYSSVAMFTLEAQINKSSRMKYLASAIGMATYLWQLKVLNISETQVYTVPVGIYFAVLAYLQRLQNKMENWNILNYAALFFLIIPGIFQSFDSTNSATYALILGIIGIGILSLGLSLNYKTYVYAGIATIVIAVLSQTYEYISSLPRWIITGLVGVGFLGTAIYLLLHRKDPQK